MWDVLSYLLFLLIACGTPGPNNLLIMTMAMRVGYRRSLAFIVGIPAGATVQMLALWLGLMPWLSPSMLQWLQGVSALYVLWLGYKVLRSFSADQLTQAASPVGTQPTQEEAASLDASEGGEETKSALQKKCSSPLERHALDVRLGFWSAVIFQFVNPKAWMISVVVVSAFPLLTDVWLNITLKTALFTVVSLHTSSLWAGFGVLLLGLLKRSHWAQRVLPPLLALCLVVIALGLLWPQEQLSLSNLG